MMDSTMAAMKSRKECCLMNMVDRQMRMVRTVEEHFTKKFLRRFFFGVCAVVRKVLLFM